MLKFSYDRNVSEYFLFLTEDHSVRQIFQQKVTVRYIFRKLRKGTYPFPNNPLYEYKYIIPRKMDSDNSELFLLAYCSD